MVAPTSVPNHNPVFMTGKLADRPIGTRLQKLPFLSVYVANDSDIMSIVTGEGSVGNVRRWFDLLASDLSDLKGPVQAATPVAIAAYTVSADKTTLTANANGAIANIDGVVITLNMRVLLRNGASAVDNGIYVVTQLGTAGTPFILTRASDMPVGAHVSGIAVDVEGGNFFSFTQLVCTATFTNDVVGTNNLTFVEQGRVIRVRANGAAALTAANCILADLHTLDTTAAGRNVALPVRSTVPNNKAYTFSVAAGANAITATPDAGAGDTINLVAAAMLTSANLFGSISLIADPNAAGNWICTNRS